MKRAVKHVQNRYDEDEDNNNNENENNQRPSNSNNIAVDEEDDIFYLPKKKRLRRIKVKSEIQEIKQPIIKSNNEKHSIARHSSVSTPTVKIIESSKSADENDSGKRDVPYEYVSHIKFLEDKKNNVLVTAFLSINLFLQPRNVYSTTLYWISQYVNYKKSNQIHWFTDHIYKLMKYPVNLNMTATRGVSDFHSKEVKYNLLLHTIGSNLHKIPNEYFIIQSNESMLRAIVYLITPSNECFITNTHHGLKGELEVDSFVYNGIMDFFYEPSFFIITSYLLYTYQLFFATGGRNILDYTNILDMIIIPLRLECKLGCLSESTTNYESKKSVFIQDIKELLDIYESNALCAEDIIQGLKDLWSKKATYCFNIVPERYLAIHKQLY